MPQNLRDTSLLHLCCNTKFTSYNSGNRLRKKQKLMAKLIFKLKSVSYDEADDIKNLLTENKIDFYESPAGNWGISMHALWLNDEAQYTQAKQLIDEYQVKRSQHIRLETQQKIDQGEYETFIQRLFNKPIQFFITLAIIIFILYFSIMPFLEIGQG